MPNRGASVSRPSVREAREVFAARQVLEAGTVAAFIGSATRADCKRLHEHVAREQAAWRQGDRRASLKSSGEFHLMIAQIAGNQILVDMLRDLVSRSSLIIAVYQAPGARCCPPDEHRELAESGLRRELVGGSWSCRSLSTRGSSARRRISKSTPAILLATAAARRTHAGRGALASRCNSF